MAFKLGDTFVPLTKKKTFTARIVEVTKEKFSMAFYDLYGKFYCITPNGYLSPTGEGDFAYYYDSVGELNKDLRGYISMFFNK